MTVPSGPWKARLHTHATIPAALLIFAAAYLFLRPYISLVEEKGLTETLRFVVDRGIYSRTVIASNYFNDGFVRRGLGGTIASLFSDDWGRSTLLFILFSFFWLIAPLALIVRWLAMTLRPVAFCYISAAILISPQTFLGWSRDPARTDLLIGGFLAWSVLATLAGHRRLGVLLVLGGFLVHETAVIFGAPLLLLMNLEDHASGRLERRGVVGLAATFAGGLGLIIILQLLLSAPSPVVAAHMLSSAPALLDDPEHRLWRDIAIYMAVAGADALRTAVCYNYSINPQYPFNAIGCMAVLTLYALILPLRRRPLAVFVAMWVPAIFMLIIANDTGRWLKLGVLNGWLITSFYLLRYKLHDDLRIPSIALGGGLLLILLAMGHTPYNHVNRTIHNWALDLGYKDPGSLREWMDSCDPDWRRYVYGIDRREPTE